MKHFFLIFFVVSISYHTNIHAQSEQFLNLLNLSKVDYKLSPILKEIGKLPTSKIVYDYSLKHIDSNFFVLYSIIPFDKNAPLNENKFISRDEDGNLIDQHIANFQKIVFDIFADAFFDYTLFDSLAVKYEFNADWGASSSFKLKEESFNGLSACTMVVLHKKEVGDILIYYISDKRDHFNEMMSSVFYSLRFK